MSIDELSRDDGLRFICECGHAAHWHGAGGYGACEHDDRCDCDELQVLAGWKVGDRFTVAALGPSGFGDRRLHGTVIGEPYRASRLGRRYRDGAVLGRLDGYAACVYPCVALRPCGAAARR